MTTAVLFVVAWWPLSWAAALFLCEGGEPAPRADALAVLAGSSAYVERTRHAARLFAEGRATKVVLTDDGQRGGWSREDERNLLFVERAARELRGGGVPEGAVEILPRAVSSTYDEAVRLREYAERSGARSLLVVTSAYQLRRARWTFGRAFRGSVVRVYFDAPPPGEGTPGPWLWWLTPAGWRAVGAEYPKLLFYFARYR